jgi:UDP-N-acetylglucosamine acyltransferase
VRDLPPYFLAEGNPAEVYGLNAVGLRRAGFSHQSLGELKDAYKMIYRSERNVSQAVSVLRETVATDEGRTLLAFLEATSDRGITK